MSGNFSSIRTILIVIAVLIAAVLTAVLAWYVTSAGDRSLPFGPDYYRTTEDSLSAGLYASAEDTSAEISSAPVITGLSPDSVPASREETSAGPAPIPSGRPVVPETALSSSSSSVKVISAVQAGSSETRYYLVTGSFSVAANAERLAARLKQDSFQNARSLDALKSGLIPVSLDDFPSLEEALRFLEAHPELEDRFEGIWILHR